MQRETLDELREDCLGNVSGLFAETLLRQKLDNLVEEEKAIELTDDEMRMLKAYRSSTKEIFSWRRPKPEGIVLPTEPTLLVDPREV
jgi:hypothetical protein